MLIYEDKDDLRFVHTVASASTLISSLAGQIKDYIVNMFPKNYFKSIFIDTAEAASAAAANKGYNAKLDKIRYPSMAITPEISLDDPVGGMDKSLQLSSTNLMLYKDLRRYYKKLLAEPTHKMSMYFASDYITTNFLFKIVVNKYIQNVDLAYYLKSRFPVGYFLYLDQMNLDTELPKTFVRMLSEVMKLDLKKEKDMKKVQGYLAMAGTQDGLILKKKNLSTGKDCFFFNHKQNFLTMISDLDAPPSVIRNQQAEDEYVVTFRVQVSSWLPNAFVFSLHKDLFKEVSPATFALLENEEPDIMDNGFYSTGFSYDIKLNRAFQLAFKNSSGEDRIAHEVVTEQFTYLIGSDTGRKTVKVFNLLKKDAKQIHAFILSNNMIVTDVFQIRLMTRNGDLSGADPIIDYDTMSVSVASEFSEDFFISVYIDRAALAAVKKAIEKDEFYFNDSGLATMAISYNNMVEDVKIYSFVNEKEKYSTDPAKSVRTMTSYGVGYIGLVDELLEDGTPNPKASQYKICVGFTDDGKPIVKCFELYNK